MLALLTLCTRHIRTKDQHFLLLAHQLKSSGSAWRLTFVSLALGTTRCQVANLRATLCNFFCSDQPTTARGDNRAPATGVGLRAEGLLSCTGGAPPLRHESTISGPAWRACPSRRARRHPPGARRPLPLLLSPALGLVPPASKCARSWPIWARFRSGPKYNGGAK